MSLNLTSYPTIDSSDVILPPLAEVHPWQRFFARHLDYLVFGLAVGMLLALTGRFEGSGTKFDLLLDVALVLSWTPCEALLLHLWGTTPGKWLFGISVETANGERLGLLSALRRSGWVMSLGMGFGIGIFCLISQWKAWGHLAENGSATWDESEGHLVVHLVVHDGFQWWHLGETAFAVVLVSVLLYLNGMLLLPYLNTLQPEGPGMSDEG